MLEPLNQNSGRHIRVLIVDDHAAVRAGLKLFLLAYNDLELAGEAANGEEAIQQCGEIQPDIVLMDLLMPRLDGLEAIRIIHQDYPGSRVIALTNFGGEEVLHQALEAGASDFLPKNISADLLAEAIRTAYASGLGAMPEAARV